MSIAYFPKPYEDELVYSVLARFHFHSGFLSSKDTANELLVKPQLKIDREFIKNLKPEVAGHLTKEMTFDDLLQKHTMYPYHGRFIDNERRKSAYNALVKMDGDFSKLFGMPQSKTKAKRMFRYCPLCVQKDREELGETYWHRIPQIRGIRICPYHKCYFRDSDVSMDSSISAKLIPAEDVISQNASLQNEIVYCQDKGEMQLVKYIVEVFLQPVDTGNVTTISEFLHFKMMGTPYISVRGEHKYFSKLWIDLKEYFKGVNGIEQLEAGHIQRILGNGRFVFEQICMIAMFLGISTQELGTMEKPSKSPERIFDDKVQELIDDGKSYREIGRQLGVGMSMVRLSVNVSKKEHRAKQIHRTNRNPPDWSTLDKKMLPLVQQAVKELKGNGVTRPCKVTAYAVGKKLDVAPHKLKKMKMCSKALIDGCDSDEIYMARKTMWALIKMQREQIPLKWWQLEHLTRYDRAVMVENLPYLMEIAPPEIMEAFESIT